MSATNLSARDELYGRVAAAWQLAPAMLGYTPALYYPGVAVTDKPDATKLWARLSIQIVSDEQSTLASFDGVRRFTCDGLLYLQLFCPKSDGAFRAGLALATVVQQAFRKPSPSGELWFMRPRVQELAPADDSYPINVSTEFRFDSLSSRPFTAQELSTYHVDAAALANL